MKLIFINLNTLQNKCLRFSNCSAIFLFLTHVQITGNSAARRLYKNETSQSKTSVAEAQFINIMKENQIKLNATAEQTR